MTILFADVTGSTSIGERLDPERLREVMDAYFAAMREEIEAEGGTVEKFIGDAVMAVFGVPVAHEDDAARALRAGLRMQRRLPELNAQLQADHEVSLQIRIGVHTGEVLATTEPRPGEPMATGDAVNAASRLQSAARPGEVLASERTIRSIRGFRTEDAGRLELKGKSEPVHAFRVLEETPAAPERGVAGLHAPMVGREEELELLRSLFGRVARERRPHLVTLYGDAGVGKSRLTREFLQTLDGRAQVVRGRCPPYGEGVTFWPLAEILKARAGILDTDPPEVALERIRSAGRALLDEQVTTDPARSTAALAFTVGAEDPDYPFSRMDPKDVRAQVHASWRSFFSALAQERPVVVVIEDIHWADPALLDLLEHLSERAQGPLLFVCPSRPELTSHRPGWGGGRRNHSSVALDPLTPDQSDRLVGFLLAVDDLSPTVRRRILERAEGNPFFLEEIVRHLIDEGFLVRDGGRWRTAPGIDDVEIPDTVQRVLAARIDLLPAEHKRVLQAAAVVGRIFWPGPLEELVSGADITETLTALEARELILSRLSSSIAGAPEFMFKHILTRDVAYESLPRRERSPAHAAIAGWIERTAGPRAREFAELLAYHYATAVTGSSNPVDEELRRRAFEHLVTASAQARGRQVLKKAERFAEQALALARDDAERATALEALGDACFAGYQGDLGWRYFGDAVRAREAAAVGHPDRKLAYLCARAAEFPTRWPGSMRQIPGPEQVEPLLDLGMRHVPQGDSEERARLQACRASWPFAFPQLELSREEGLGCERAGMEAAEMALRLARPDIASGAFDAAAGFAISLGSYRRALDIEERRLELSEGIGDFELGDLYAMLAWGNYELGAYERGLRMADQGLTLIGGREPTVGVHLIGWRAALRARLGDWDGATADLGEVRSLLDDRRDDPPYFASHAYAVAATIFERRGESVESDRLTGLLLPLAGHFSARLFGWLVILLVERGDLEKAGELMEVLPPSWRVHAATVFEARCELVAAAGRWGEVPELLVQARAYADASGSRSLPAFADRLEGRLTLATGEASEAARLLSRTVDGFRDLQTPYEAAVTRMDLARSLMLSGRREDALLTLDRAQATLEDLGAAKRLVSVRDLRAEA